MENTSQTPQTPQQQVAEIRLSYSTTVKPSQRPKVTTSRDAHAILMESWDKEKIEFVEQFKVMLLNRGGRVLGICEISQGSSAGTVADPKLIFAAAIKANATGIILSHNHPSGSLKPSEPDLTLTRKLKEGAKLLELSVLDHIIVSTEGYYSMTDEGVI